MKVRIVEKDYEAKLREGWLTVDVGEADIIVTEGDTFCLEGAQALGTDDATALGVEIVQAEPGEIKQLVRAGYRLRRVPIEARELRA